MRQSVSAVGLGNLVYHDLEYNKDLSMFGSNGKFDSDKVDLWGAAAYDHITISTRNPKGQLATISIAKDKIDELIEFLQKTKDL